MFDPTLYQPVREIAAHEEANYLWHERVGIWQNAGWVPGAGDLARLRNRLLRDFGLRAAWEERTKGTK